jgi:hypothetical protein
MEKSIKDIQVADQIKQSLQQVSTNPTYDHIILTEEETKAWTEWGLLKGRKRKAALLAEIAYAQKIGKPQSYATMDYDQLTKYILAKNPGFVLDDDNREIFELLCQYFSGDPGFELSGQYSFEKGILLRGPIGCGKTSMMKMFGSNTFRPFGVTACLNIADAYQMEGAEALYKYSNLMPVIPQMNHGFSEIGHCFDDLGTEDEKKNFGNQVDVMQNILYKVYDNRLLGHVHMTTNLGGDQIETMYGSRIRSRMREMFNLIKFSTEAKDRRK